MYRKELPLLEIENVRQCYRKQDLSFLLHQSLTLCPHPSVHTAKEGVNPRESSVLGEAKKIVLNRGLVELLAILNPSFLHLVYAKTSKLWAPY